MIQLPKEDRPTYILSYPRPVRLGRAAVLLLLIGTALVRWVLAWVHLILPLVQGADLAAQPLRPLIAAHLSLLLAAGAVAVVYAFLPDLSLADEGLAVRTIWGWQAIPWGTVTAVRVAGFERSPHRLVLVQGRWARRSPWPRLVSACLGAGLEPGLLFTSAIRDFRPLLERLRQEVAQAAPNALFDDEFFSLPAGLVVEPEPTLAGLVEQARDEGWPLALSAQAMGAVAGGLGVVNLLLLALVGGAWWRPLVVILLTGVEWGLGMFYLYALAEVFPGEIELRPAALLYPLPQVPRALLAVPMAMFVGSGAPFPAAMLGMAGVLWAVTLTALLVQQVFRLQSVLPAMAGAVLQALFQFLALILLFGG